MGQAPNGFVVKINDVVKGVYPLNDHSHIKHINDQLTKNGYSVWLCNVTDNNGVLTVSGNLQACETETIAPKPFERLIDSSKLPTSPDMVLLSVYNKLLESPEGISKDDVWDMINKVLTTMPAFTLRMKRLLAGKPHELVKEGNKYKLIQKQPKTE